MKIYVHAKINMQMFMAALCIITKTLDTTQVPQRGNEYTVVHPFNGLLLFTNKRNEQSVHATICTNLECILSSDRG